MRWYTYRMARLLFVLLAFMDAAAAAAWVGAISLYSNTIWYIRCYFAADTFRLYLLFFVLRTFFLFFFLCPFWRNKEMALMILECFCEMLPQSFSLDLTDETQTHNDSEKLYIHTEMALFWKIYHVAFVFVCWEKRCFECRKAPPIGTTVVFSLVHKTVRVWVYNANTRRRA